MRRWWMPPRGVLGSHVVPHQGGELVDGGHGREVQRTGVDAGLELGDLACPACRRGVHGIEPGGRVNHAWSDDQPGSRQRVADERAAAHDFRLVSRGSVH
jgi:hypothetical protein